MKCKICKFDEATEFHGPTGVKISRGYCLACYGRAIRQAGQRKSPASVGMYDGRCLSVLPDEVSVDWLIDHPNAILRVKSK